MAPGFWAAYAARLAIVAVVLIVLYAVARKLQAAKLFARSGRRLELLESAMLSQHAALHLVRTGTRYFLIGSATSGVTRLAELSDAELTGAHPSTGSG
ncbi:MAG: FliO/MopB family protein [Candidatus Eremiobacteraeota bacterium]|nr:FliO/MopB family protein [Candidatus Eremiobacteraeota bacterium]